jgi:hypothetical protein
MDEGIHELIGPSGTTFLAGPTTVFATSDQPYPTSDQPYPPQMGQYPNPGASQPVNPVDRSVLLTNEEILLQTRNRQYGMPPDSTPTTLETLPTTFGQPLMIPRPNVEPILRIPCMPLQQNVHKPHARAAHNYSLVDDLAQSLVAMSVLEVLQTCSSQCVGNQ